jgi:4-oxalocrotonate tautomerase
MLGPYCQETLCWPLGGAIGRGRERYRRKPMPEIYVHAVEGRSLEQKRGLIRDITAAVVKHFDVGAESVMVQIVESSKQNKAKGGVLFSER